MHTDEYKAFIEDLTTNDVDLALTEKQIEKFAVRSKELETETDFSEEDIIEELNVLVSPRHHSNDDWQCFIEELAKIILDEILAETDDDDMLESDVDAD